MSDELSTSAQRVQEALRSRGFELKVVEMPASTRTSPEAAAAVGCEVGQIAKSLVFRTMQTGRAVLVIASGSNRVDEKKVGRLLGEKIGKADADFVRDKTGYAIGGIPPVGHLEALETYIDEDLLTYDVIWAAAGTPHAVFELTPPVLTAMTGGRVANLRRDG